MNNIPAIDPGSGEIQSPIIAGISEGLSKISSAMNIEEGTLTNEALNEVYISSLDRFRIYQADDGKRLWNNDIVIKINGVETTAEAGHFEIDYVGGAIAFDPAYRKTSEDVITVTGTYASTIGAPSVNVFYPLATVSRETNGTTNEIIQTSAMTVADVSTTFVNADSLESISASSELTLIDDFSTDNIDLTISKPDSSDIIVGTDFKICYNNDSGDNNQTNAKLANILNRTSANNKYYILFKKDLDFVYDFKKERNFIAHLRFDVGDNSLTPAPDVKAALKIYISDDGENWNLFNTFNSSENTLDLNITTRYLKLNFDNLEEVSTNFIEVLSIYFINITGSFISYINRFTIPLPETLLNTQRIFLRTPVVNTTRVTANTLNNININNTILSGDIEYELKYNGTNFEVNNLPLNLQLSEDVSSINIFDLITNDSIYMFSYIGTVSRNSANIMLSNGTETLNLTNSSAGSFDNNRNSIALLNIINNKIIGVAFGTTSTTNIINLTNTMSITTNSVDYLMNSGAKISIRRIG